MTGDQIEKAKEIASQHGARIAEASGAAEKLQAIRAQLSKPGAQKALAAASSPQTQKAFDLMEAKAEPVWPGPSQVVLPKAPRIDHAQIKLLMEEDQEAAEAKRAEKQGREQRMIQLLEGMRTEMTTSGKLGVAALAAAVLGIIVAIAMH
jgi:hypothetical protein